MLYPMAAVKGRRYDATGRQAGSHETRQRILSAARSAMVEHGYHGATVARIAQDAGVNVDTVYALVGRKPVILHELIEQAISGTNEAVPAPERDYVMAIRAEPDPARKLAIYAAAMRSIMQRLAPLFMALRDASSTDSEASAVWHQISERRAGNMRLLAEDLRQAGGLRLSARDTADVLWLSNSAEVFTMLTVERGWSPARYERWLTDTWQRLLLPD